MTSRASLWNMRSKAGSWNKIQLAPNAPKVRIIYGEHTGRVGWLLAEYERIYLIWLNEYTRVFAEKDAVVFE